MFCQFQQQSHFFSRSRRISRKMTKVYILAILLCLSQFVLTTFGHPGSEDDEWADDAFNNPETMGMIPEDDAPPSRSFAAARLATSVNQDDGEWVDDVTGNMFIMGEDPLTQSTGLSDDMNSDRKKRSAGNKMLKDLRKAFKKGKRDLADTSNGDREKRSSKKSKGRKSLLKALKKI